MDKIEFLKERLRDAQIGKGCTAQHMCASCPIISFSHLSTGCYIPQDEAVKIVQKLICGIEDNEVKNEQIDS